MIDRSTIPVANEDIFIKRVCNESNNDLRDPAIQKYLSIGKEMKVNDEKNSNYRMNRIFYMNYFYAIQAKFKVENMYQDRAIYDLLKVKVSSHISHVQSTISDGFKEILKLDGLPNINMLVADGVIDFKMIYQLRNHKHCIEFRKWLRG